MVSAGIGSKARSPCPHTTSVPVRDRSSVEPSNRGELMNAPLKGAVYHEPPGRSRSAASNRRGSSTVNAICSTCLRIPYGPSAVSGRARRRRYRASPRTTARSRSFRFGRTVPPRRISTAATSSNGTHSRHLRLMRISSPSSSTPEPDRLIEAEEPERAVDRKRREHPGRRRAPPLEEESTPNPCRPTSPESQPTLADIARHQAGSSVRPDRYGKKLALLNFIQALVVLIPFDRSKGDEKSWPTPVQLRIPSNNCRSRPSPAPSRSTSLRF